MERYRRLKRMREIKITDPIFTAIMDLNKLGYKDSVIANLLGVGTYTVTRILDGKFIKKDKQT